MFVIRKATREDVPAILALVRELAAYEREAEAVVATEEDFLRDGFGERPAFEVMVAEALAAPPEAPGAPGAPEATQARATREDPGAKRLIGLAFYFFSYSTWLGRKCLYLEDLFVQPSYRGRGAGIALMRALAQVAVETQCRRFVWQVLDWNSPAIAFYEKLGAKVMREWLTVRMEGEALTRLARAPGANDPDRC